MSDTPPHGMPSTSDTAGMVVKVEARLVRFIFTVFAVVVVALVVGLGSAGGSLFWALLKSQDTVEQLSTLSECRSAAAVAESAALNDLIILLADSSAGAAVTSAQLDDAKAVLRAAQANRLEVLVNGCVETDRANDG